MRSLAVSIALTLALACSNSKGKPPPSLEINDDVAASGEGFAVALFQSVDAELGPGTVTRLDNGAVFDTLVAEIDRAKTSIHIAMYIWEAGVASTRVTAALAARARAGVACRIVIDAFGSSKFEAEVSPPLVAAGCEVRMFRPVSLGTLTNRNHRKIVVVDGAVAIIGGFGVRDDWMGDGVTGWRDTNVRFTGKAVRGAQQAFAENWQEAGGKLLPVAAFPTPPDDGRSRLAFVASTASSEVTRAERLIQILAAAAHHRLWIANAYFAPSKAILAVIERKARSGVDVRLLVPGDHDDSKPALVAQRALYSELAAAGVRVWEYQPSMMHAKTMVIDDRLSSVASINLDPLSLNRLDEVALVIEDAEFNGKLAAAFEADCAHASAK